MISDETRVLWEPTTPCPGQGKKWGGWHSLLAASSASVLRQKKAVDRWLLWLVASSGGDFPIYIGPCSRINNTKHTCAVAQKRPFAHSLNTTTSAIHYQNTHLTWFHLKLIRPISNTIPHGRGQVWCCGVHVFIWVVIVLR